jgi:hypothetical protein
MKFMAQCSRKKVGLTIGMAKNAVNSKDYSKFIGLGLKLQSDRIYQQFCYLYLSVPER